MRLRLIRYVFTEKSTIGLLLVNDNFECYTLEDKDREASGVPVELWKVAKETAIPSGEYTLVIDFSTRFKAQMPHILDVRGFDGIRIHKGNRPEDTEGCPVVGLTRGIDSVGASEVAFSNLFQKLAKATQAKEDISIKIERLL